MGQFFCQYLFDCLMWLHLTERTILDGLTLGWIISRVFATTSSSLDFFTWWLQGSMRIRIESVLYADALQALEDSIQYMVYLTRVCWLNEWVDL